MRMCACRGTAGFVHVSCLAEQAKILYAEAEENNLDGKVRDARWKRWHKCGLCEQEHRGVVSCALGWACWKTYVGRPEGNGTRQCAMTLLGNGLCDAEQDEDALSLREAELSTKRRVGASEESILVAQTNLANTYGFLHRREEALSMRRDAYSGYVKLHGIEHSHTLIAANNYANYLKELSHFEEAKSLLRKTIPVARRVLGESNDLTLNMRWIYAEAICEDESATLVDLREAVARLEEIERTARRVLGGGHPTTESLEESLRDARATLRAREPK